MVALIILFLGTFWEASMDMIGMKHNYDQSWWQSLANYFDEKGKLGLGNRFWDNSIAWRNKWKNGERTQGEAFFGSSTVFVSFVDGWHLVKLVWLMHVFAAIVFYNAITSYFLVDIALLYATFGIGHDVFWRLLLRPSSR